MIDKALPAGVRDMKDCPVPLAVSVFDLLSFRTKIITEGKISTALRASSTFPLMFSPVWHPQGVLIDGGVSDCNGEACAGRIASCRPPVRDRRGRLKGGVRAP